MYATKPLSVFTSHPAEAASLPPAEGGSSGYLVAMSADDGAEETSWWGYRGETRLRGLPFPQNRVITVRDPAGGEYTESYADAVVFVPVPGLPLSSNRYYAVLAKGKDRGLVRACSREEDVATRCFCRCIRDAKPRPFDPDDVYQQMEIVPNHKGDFTARAVAADGHPYFLYRSKYWQAYASRPKHFDLGEALGLNDPLRSRQLNAQDLTLPAAAAVGRWYCPFFFIKEDGVALKKQLDRSTFYEVVLEQRWEAVVAAPVNKRVLVGGSVEGKQEPASSRHGDKYVWFTAAAGPAGQRVGVSACLWERMRHEEHRGGWVDEEAKDAGRKMATGGGSVLVERFAVKRMDGSVAVAFDFVHHGKVRAKQQ